MPKKQSPTHKSEPEVFVIKSLLDYDKRGETEYFKVEWDGYSIEDATWEPLESFDSPIPEIRKRMNQLRKAKASAIENGSPAITPKNKRKQLSSPSNQMSKKRRPTTDDALPPKSPSSSTKKSNKEGSALFPLRKEEEEEASEVEASEDEEEEEQFQDKSMYSHSPFSDVRPRDADVQVKNIRKNERGSLDVVVHWRDGSTAVSVEDAREKYPQALIDFLLCRIQFRGSGSREPV